ncbi:P-loop containing nucleoside triphosphate hydrolase protein [Lentinus tigrinus ALCF2SS1-7]|uniref:Signal recognition particle receptor subunit beta n=1 Tax=Lentinus tigrinus ALCF2SS1-6 TaxID=1328759 RepID=A0A5C2STG7_9APHY|nr:P-loop containing nucleoside triphosphate hydrolase protein [Lentinus tigrinus ALCF2SS1-6]RPD80310.1 P-loop containing nucleoside triphosphate hydrolase protein [Lentinus tigrinus ALCF2SS1-7]
MDGVTPTPEVLSPSTAFTPQFQIVAALVFAVVLVIISVFLAKRKSTQRGDAVILAGCSDAGKTAILSTLVYKQTLPTHTSMQTNAALMVLPQGHKTLRLIDVPGHPRIRDQFQEYLPHAKAVAFVVDSSTISRNGAAVAEHLHMILNALTSLPPSRGTPSLTIVAHKCDLMKSTAHASAEQLAINRIRTILERELEKRRASHANGVGVESLGAEDADSQVGGLECTGSGEFKFAEWEGGEVGFVGTSVSVGKEAVVSADEKHPQGDGLSPLREWLEDLP